MNEPRPGIWQLTRALFAELCARAVASRVILIFLCGAATGGGATALYVFAHPIAVTVDAKCAGWINADELFGKS